MPTPASSRTWRLGFVLVLLVPFIGLVLTLTDPPTWLQIAGLVVMVALVGVASSLLRRGS
jgi:hypothetical protein